jgi:peptide-methionine (S)-S-oxide reductase
VSSFISDLKNQFKQHFNPRVFRIKIMATKEATLGARCFWCVEACFKDLKGVSHVEPGYSGGHIKNPGYKEVCTGRTGHAEVVRIVFDDEQISYEEILEVFWFVHDPTTLNRQGNDIGEQYKSVVYYHDEAQQLIAKDIKEKLDASGAWSNPIVTEISPLINYYSAEDYHRDYFAINPDQPYCAAVVRPKVEKFRKVFAGKLR